MIISSQFAVKIWRGFFTLGDGCCLPMPALRPAPPFLPAPVPAPPPALFWNSRFGGLYQAAGISTEICKTTVCCVRGECSNSVELCGNFTEILRKVFCKISPSRTTPTSQEAWPPISVPSEWCDHCHYRTAVNLACKDGRYTLTDQVSLQ